MTGHQTRVAEKNMFQGHDKIGRSCNTNRGAKTAQTLHRTKAVPVTWRRGEGAKSFRGLEVCESGDAYYNAYPLTLAYLRNANKEITK